MAYRLLFCLLAIFVALKVPNTYAYQGAYLVKGEKYIFIADGYVGFTTPTDTIKFEGQQELSFTIVAITNDSITIRRPEIYTNHDLLYKKKKYAAIQVQQYEYCRYALKDITTFQYPSKADERGIGCMGCAIAMVVPGVNIYLYYKLRNRYHPSNYKMCDGWHFEVKEVK